MQISEGRKICSKCNSIKLLKHFANKGRQSYCLQCGRKYGIANYHKNKPRYYAAVKAREKRMDEMINGHKDGPCSDCGVKYPPYVMDFDHRPEENKLHGVSHMRKRRMAFAKIEAEIAKCDLVCSNCHRERTNTRNPARYD